VDNWLKFRVPAPISWINFNNTVADQVGNNDGTWSGTPTYVTGNTNLGNVGSFNGTDRYVTLDNEPDFDLDNTDPMTVSFWIKSPIPGINEVVVGKKSTLFSLDAGWIIWLDGVNPYTFLRIEDGSTVIQGRMIATALDNTWHHVVWTWAGGTTEAAMKCFLDGIEIAVTDDTSNSITTMRNNIPVVIGAAGNTTDKYSGLVNEVMIFDYEMSADQVATLFHSEVWINEVIPKTKYDLINWFAKEYDFSSYLEICTLSTGNYFDKVDSYFFKIKDCINYYVEDHDPYYSKFGNAVLKDHDFKILPFDDHLKKIIDKNQKYDVIFVDSFHTVEHTIRDLEAALSLLSSTGIIIVHDCFPDSEAVIGPWKEDDWSGQTYEGYIRFLLKNSHFENFVINIDYGCGIIRPHNKSTIKRDFAVDVDKLSSWEYYWDHHNQLLNLKSIDKFYDLYRSKESF